MSGQGGASNGTSYQQFRAIEGELSEREAKVLSYIRRHPSGTTMKAIAEEMGVEFNTISGRRKDLVKAGMIRLTGRRDQGCEVIEPVSAPQQESRPVTQPLLFEVAQWT